MKTNDLRIGNLVLNDDDGGVCKLFNIHEGYINHKPIPLTEEWLLKFGFKSIQDGWYEYSNSNITFSWNIYDRQLRFLGEPFNIQYVHQLQNLYFALTGEELEVKQ